MGHKGGELPVVYTAVRWSFLLLKTRRKVLKTGILQKLDGTFEMEPCAAPDKVTEAWIQHTSGQLVPFL